MKHRVLIALGVLLAVAVVSAGSILVYEQFRPLDRRHTERVHSGSRKSSPPRGVSESLRSGSVLPLEQALEIQARELPGEVLKVELEDEHGRAIYEIKVLAGDGRVRKIKLDAKSGLLTEIEDD